MVWQQWRAIQVESGRARAHAVGVDPHGRARLGRVILREDARTAGVDHLGEPWAVPLAEARLSTFLARTATTTPTTRPKPSCRGTITDAQARYNLTNLVDRRTRRSSRPSGGAAAPVRDGGVSPETARPSPRPAAALPPTSPPTARPHDPPLAAAHGRASWAGSGSMSGDRRAPATLRRCCCPSRTPVNVNTASREVLAAASPASIRQRRTASCKRRPVKNAAGPARATLQATGAIDPDASAGSNYFEVARPAAPGRARPRAALAGAAHATARSSSLHGASACPARAERCNALIERQFGEQATETPSKSLIAGLDWLL